MNPIEARSAAYKLAAEIVSFNRSRNPELATPEAVKRTAKSISQFILQGEDSEPAPVRKHLELLPFSWVKRAAGHYDLMTLEVTFCSLVVDRPCSIVLQREGEKDETFVSIGEAMAAAVNRFTAWAHDNRAQVIKWLEARRGN